MTADPAVLVPFFASLNWPLRLRLVSQDWRYVFDKWCPRASKRSKMNLFHSRKEVHAAAKDESLPDWLGLYVSLHVGVTQEELSGITDYGNVHTLDLNGCSRITDVSTFGNVHSLYLSWCKGVTDVSALGNVRILVLDGCTGVTDVSALGNVHTLYIGWSGVTDADVSALIGKGVNLRR